MMTPPKENRIRTLGVVCGWTFYEPNLELFVDPLFNGIKASALDHNINLLFSCGINTENHDVMTAWPYPSSDTDFLPVGPENTDGLIIILPLLSPQRSDYVQSLIQRGFPIVFIGTGENGMAVAADNTGGIRKAILHLKEHGHRRIFFLAGYDDERDDSLERLLAYKNAIKEFGLDAESKLIAFGNHNSDVGYAAIQRALAEGIQFTAIVASDDGSAFGAMRALKEAGKEIPKDVAIIGFDDHPDSKIQQPPLTTIQYPVYDAGYLAVDLLFRKIGSIFVKDQVFRVPTRLTIRESCGCSPAWSKPVDHKLYSPPQAGEKEINPKEKLENAVRAFILAEYRQVNPDEINEHCRHLVTSFLSSITESNPNPFYAELRKIIDWIETHELDAHVWQSVISVFSDNEGLFLDHTQHQSRRLMNHMLQNARTAISESVWKRYHQHISKQVELTNQLSWLAVHFEGASEEAQINQILLKDLRQTGIQHAYLVLFEAIENDPMALSQIMISDENSEQIMEWRFRSRQFPPEGLYQPGGPVQLILIPVVVEGIQIGFVSFDATNYSLMGTIIRQVSATLENVRLHKQVVQLSNTDSLTGLFNRRYLDNLIANLNEQPGKQNFPYSVLMADIDHFKEYNDKYGHISGDQALKNIAQCLLSVTHSNTDVVVRYGGEEFLIILPKTSESGAIVVAENIREAISSQPGFKQKITVSQGIATGEEKDFNIGHQIQNADQTLYLAKNSGRDCIKSYHPQ
jgi:diguanylate cyclase (GGDEF)-like protein